jgi:NADH:ubiquinone oxidoreductase subunit 3 (subunit A)
MIGAALALIVLGVIVLFLFPWGGIVIGAVGLVLLLVFLIGLARPTQPGRSTR